MGGSAISWFLGLAGSKFAWVQAFSEIISHRHFYMLGYKWQKGFNGLDEMQWHTLDHTADDQSSSSYQEARPWGLEE